MPESTPETLSVVRPGLAGRARGRLTGRVALVTGAGDSGDDVPSIGHAIAVVLALAGARVAVIDIDQTATERTVRTIEASGHEALAVGADVTNRATVDYAVENIIQTWGRLDIVVNNAAVLGAGATLAADDDAIMRTLDINLMGAIRVSRAAHPHLGAGASIVHISSLGAVRSFGKLDYEASKGAINSVVNTMAIELGPSGIRVNGVSPGQVWTPMGLRRLVDLGMTPAEIREHRAERAGGVPLKREGSAWDIAAATLFLASDDAAWITGQVLMVDGGQSGVVGYTR